MKTKLMALEALKLALPHINPKAIDGVRVEAEPIADCYVNTIVSATIAAIEADIAKPVKLHGWMVSGVSRVYFGDHAEMDATQEARKCGGTAKAYPIYTTPQEPAAAALLKTLIEAREALQFANDSPKGPICDTIWMMHRPETLFDFLDVAIENSTAAPGCAA